MGPVGPLHDPNKEAKFNVLGLLAWALFYL